MLRASPGELGLNTSYSFNTSTGCQAHQFTSLDSAGLCRYDRGYFGSCEDAPGNWTEAGVSILSKGNEREKEKNVDLTEHGNNY